jgi:Lipid A disaccharide synthetase
VDVAIFTGEASGDRVGAQLVQEMRRLRPDWTFWGAGGKYLRDAGVEVAADTSRWSVVGVAQGLALLPRAVHALNSLGRELERRRPGLVIAVDAGAFNIGFGPIRGICPRVREHLPETPIFYYFPPGSWRRQLNRTDLTEMADAVATPFPWSESELRRFGVDATFVGHPLLDLVQPSLPPDEFAARHGIDREHPVVGILPGSRRAEIEQILPVQLEAATVIHQRVPGVQFVLALAPTVDRARVEAMVAAHDRVHAARQQAEEALREAERLRASEGGEGAQAIGVPVGIDGQSLSPEEMARRQREWLRRAAEMPRPPAGPLPLALVDDATYDVMAASDVLLICSGTATLEAAILGKPMVILYRMGTNAVNRVQYVLVKKNLPRFIGLPNLLADREVVPERIQDAATPDGLAEPVIDYLLEPERMLQARKDLQAVISLLGEKGGAARAAALAVDLAERGRRQQPQQRGAPGTNGADGR